MPKFSDKSRPMPETGHNRFNPPDESPSHIARSEAVGAGHEEYGERLKNPFREGRYEPNSESDEGKDDVSIFGLGKGGKASRLME